jgi:hypothetical protein
MQESDLHYPADTCPFCNIAAAFPFPHERPGLWRRKKKEELEGSVPGEEEADIEKTDPSAFVVLRSRDVVAFLDILPMTRGEYSRTWGRRGMWRIQGDGKEGWR